MKLEVLGTGCPRCKKLVALVEETVRETGTPAEVVKIDRIEDIVRYGVMMMPALAVNGRVVIAGRLPSKDEIRKLLEKRA